MNTHQTSAPRRGIFSPWLPLRPLFDWFLRYPVLFLEVLLLLLIVWGVVWDPLSSATIGLPGLFWHELPGIAFAAGLGVGLLLGAIGFVGYLLQANDGWLQRPKQSAAEPARRHSTLWYFLGTGVYPVLVLLAVFPAFFAFGDRWPFAAGCAAGGVVGVLLAWSASFLRPEKTVFFDWLVNLPRLKDELPGSVREGIFARRRFVCRLSKDERRAIAPYFHLHALQIVVTIVLVSVYLALFLTVLYGDAEIVSPALVLCVLWALFGGLYGFLMFHFPRAHFGVALLLVAAFLLFRTYVPRPYRFDGLDYDHPVDLAEFDPPSSAGDAEAALLDNEAVLNAWRQTPPAGDKPVLIVVTVSGGGIRASAWTALVLARLERELAAFPYHVRLVTGASGGMVGAAYYVATLRPPDQMGHELTTNPQADALEQLVSDISQDALSPVARHMLFPLPGDRGTALEEAWEHNTGGVLKRSLAELRTDEAAGWRPSLVFSPMLVEDGRRLLVSNLDLSSLTSSEPSLLAGGDPAQRTADQPPAPRDEAFSVSGVQFYELFPGAQGLKLSTAARMSAAFPLISPAAELPTRPLRRVVDAGYYDNFGVNLGGRWLYQERKWLRGREGTDQRLAGVVLIQIRDLLEDRRDLSSAGKEPSAMQRSIGQLTAPLEGVLRARNSTMSFRNDELVALLDQVFNDPDLSEPVDVGPGRRDFFRTFIFEFPQSAPLSWHLTPETRRAMDAAVDDKEGAFQRELAEFKAWWDGR